MDIFYALLEGGKVLSRKELAAIFDTSDRRMRKLIQKARRMGVPIMALPEGGYKLAETEEEKQRLLHMYKGRAMDELFTYSALKKTFQIDGQEHLEIMEETRL